MAPPALTFLSVEPSTTSSCVAHSPGRLSLIRVVPRLKSCKRASKGLFGHRRKGSSVRVRVLWLFTQTTQTVPLSIFRPSKQSTGEELWQQRRPSGVYWPLVACWNSWCQSIDGSCTATWTVCDTNQVLSGQCVQWKHSGAAPRSLGLGTEAFLTKRPNLDSQASQRAPAVSRADSELVFHKPGSTEKYRLNRSGFAPSFLKRANIAASTGKKLTLICGRGSSNSAGPELKAEVSWPQVSQSVLPFPLHMEPRLWPKAVFRSARSVDVLKPSCSLQHYPITSFWYVGVRVRGSGGFTVGTGFSAKAALE